MIEQVCPLLKSFSGAEGTATTPHIKARAVCFATQLDQCPKGRKKLMITPMCFRIREFRLPKATEEVNQ